MVANSNILLRCINHYAVIFAMAALFLLPEVVNGFPLVFSDTGTYMGLWTRNFVDRPAYYAIFNRVIDLHLSPWPAVVAQSLMTAWIIRCFASSLFDIIGTLRLLWLTALLTLGTSLPWFVSWIMPDVFTGLMIIALCLLCFAHDLLRRSSMIFLVLLIAAAVAFHQSNLPIAVSMLPALALCACLGWRPSKAFLHGLLAGGIGLALGMVGLITMNLVLSGSFGLSSSGSVFLLARMLADGTSSDTLKKFVRSSASRSAPLLTN
jgi:hypothetical protein